MRILFVCKYNRFRSKVAEALFRKYCADADLEVDTDSCGIVIDESRPYVAEITKLLLAQKKAHVKNDISKRVSSYLVSWADKIIIVADNVLMEGVFPKNKTEVWGIKDVSESNPLDVSRIIEEIDKKVKELVSKIKIRR
jgi:protein-tyrosine-phosphatase